MGLFGRKKSKSGSAKGRVAARKGHGPKAKATSSSKSKVETKKNTAQEEEYEIIEIIEFIEEDDGEGQGDGAQAAGASAKKACAGGVSVAEFPGEAEPPAGESVAGEASEKDSGFPHVASNDPAAMASEKDDETETTADGDEILELEIDEDDIHAYLVDEDDNEIGFVVLDADGNEEEYYYPEPIPPAKANKGKAASSDEYDLGITREGVADTTADLNAIYKDGMEVATELKETFDDISSSLDFLNPKKKKRK